MNAESHIYITDCKVFSLIAALKESKSKPTTIPLLCEFNPAVMASYSIIKDKINPRLEFSNPKFLNPTTGKTTFTAVQIP